MGRDTLLERLIRMLQRIIRYPIALCQKLFVYREIDSSSYWRGRAALPGEKAVMFENEFYTAAVRTREFEWLKRLLAGLHPDAAILDLGCGVGIVAAYISQLNADWRIDAVDFQEMIKQASSRVVRPNVSFISSPAEDFCPSDRQYDAILSIACLSAIRDLAKLHKALDNIAKLSFMGSRVILIDPFHRSPLLARARISSKEVIDSMRAHGFKLEIKSGILFWPFRLLLARSKLRGKPLLFLFNLGEGLLALLGAHAWADYKVLVFRKNA